MCSELEEYKDDLREYFGLPHDRSIQDFICVILNQLEERTQQLEHWQKMYIDDHERLTALRTLCKKYSLGGFPEGSEIVISFTFGSATANAGNVVCTGLLKDLNLLLKERK